MKGSILSAALIAGIESQRGLLERPNEGLEDGPERRYNQLVSMMSFYNSEFDERKYWTYGCQCLMLGDRPMSEPGVGPPIDALDQVCKQYKDCLRCAREEFGEMCIGEFQRYSYGGKRKGDIFCRNKPEYGQDAACKRKLCECDLAFAKNHVSQTHVFNKEKHMFWSTYGWEPKDECPRVGGGPYQPKCCGTATGASLLYNSVNHKCCADGSVVHNSNQCY